MGKKSDAYDAELEEIQLAIVQTQVEPLIDALRKALPTPQIAYWAAPLLAFGRLGSLS